MNGGQFKPGSYAELDAGLKPANRRFATEVRNILRSLGGSLAQIERRLHELFDNARDIEGARPQWAVCSASTMSRWIGGRVKVQPNEALLRPLHLLAEAQAGDGVVVPSWDSHPLHIAWKELGVALDKGGKRRGRRPRVLRGPASQAAELPVGVVPVPLREGDRHNADGSFDVAWPEAKLIVGYIDAGDLARANGLIRHVGSVASPREAVAAVKSCRIVGSEDAAEAILAYAANREDVLDVVEIAYGLLVSEGGPDASMLLKGVLAAAGRCAS